MRRIVRDMGRLSKIGARCPMRNEHSYNSSLGPTRVGAIQTPVSVAPKTARVSRPPLRRLQLYRTLHSAVRVRGPSSDASYRAAPLALTTWCRALNRWSCERCQRVSLALLSGLRWSR